MWDLTIKDYADETVVDKCRKSFLRVYPEFKPVFLGVSQDKTCLIAKVNFPDGTFYFRISESSVSSAYRTIEEADKNS